jgi:hypothetical protein
MSLILLVQNGDSASQVLRGSLQDIGLDLIRSCDHGSMEGILLSNKIEGLNPYKLVGICVNSGHHNECKD